MWCRGLCLGESAQSAELLIERMSAESECCGASVRAVVRVLDEMSLSQQFAHFFKCQTLA